MCPTHSEAKQYQNIGVWSRERFIAGSFKENGWLTLRKTPELLEGFQRSIFNGQVREGHPRICGQLMLSCLVDGDQSLDARRSGGYVLMIIK